MIILNGIGAPATYSHCLFSTLIGIVVWPLPAAINDMIPVKKFIDTPREGRKFICHCHEEIPRTPLQQEIEEGQSNTVLIGPEGDFSIEEVEYALKHGYESVSLGDFRLRTETAALVALMTIRLKVKG